MAKSAYNSLSEFLYSETDTNTPLTQQAVYESVLEQVRDHISQNHADDLSAVITDPDSALTVRRLISRYIADEDLRVEGLSMTQLSDMVYSDMVGFGFLETYIRDTNIEEINGNSWRDIEIVRMDSYEKLPMHFSSPQRAVDTIRKMARLGGLILDNTTPIIDSFISKGIRLSAAIPPIVDSDTGVAFSLRRQRMARTTADDLLAWQTASEEELDLMVLLASHGVSVCVSGATSSGKTTDLSFILNALDRKKRIYTIEETRELDLTREDDEGHVVSRVVHLCTRSSTTAELVVSPDDLLRHALRFHPDIIVPAEMRGEEAMTAQEAARTGHAVVTSLHANSAREAYGRILSMCRMSGTLLEDQTLMRFIAEAFPIMVFKKQLDDGTRRVMEITEAVGVTRSGEIRTSTLYKYDVDTRSHLRNAPLSDLMLTRLHNDGATFDQLRPYMPESYEEKGE